MANLKPILAVGPVVAVVVAACGQAILTAPSGSLLHISANPVFVTANGDVSVVSVLVTEPTGTVVPDGTVVQFFTDLGRIQEQGRTNDGVVRVNFTSDSRSGQAHITAFSGGVAVSPSTPPTNDPNPSPSGTPTPGSTPTPTPTATPTATPTFNPGPGPNPSPRNFGLGEGDGTNTATITIAVGSTLPARLIVEPVPSQIVSPGAADINVFVLDANGNPVAGVPIFVSLIEPQAATERLASGGRPLFTDRNGFVSDRLLSSAPAGSARHTVTVQAATPNDKRVSVTVTIN